MYVADVIPFSPGAPDGSLSYRTSEKLPVGSIVTVGLRRKKVPGVVVGIENAHDAKASLKAASFVLSGTISKPEGAIPLTVMDAVARTALWHASSIGAVLAQLLAPWIEDGDLVSLAGTPGTGFLVRSFEYALHERKARYRTLIDECVDSKGAVLLVVSTIAEVEFWRKAFADLSPVVLSGALKEAKRKLALGEARSSRGLVIATPHFSFAQMRHLDTLIIERAGAGGFRMPKRPYLDTRVALLELARARALRIVHGDYPLPLEYRSGIRKLPGKPVPVTVINAGKERAEGESWSAVPGLLRERISEELMQGGRVAVVAARKGYSPVVVCRDCGHVLRDERGKVYAFSIEGGRRLFRTADGRSELSSERNCPTCESWNLLPLGVGVERVAEELRSAFPATACVLFDADTVRTASGAKKRLAPLADLGSIVVGTEAMVPWLFAASPAPLSLAAVASADSLLALPFWRARERFLRLGYLLSDLAPSAMLATRLPDDAAVRTLKNPEDPAFFEEEGELRRALSYPPYGTLISLSWQGTQGGLDKLEREVRNAIGAHPARIVPDRFVRGNVSQRTLVLLIPKDAWPDADLSSRLASLPPSVRVLVDPESFW